MKQNETTNEVTATATATAATTTATAAAAAAKQAAANKAGAAATTTTVTLDFIKRSKAGNETARRYTINAANLVAGARSALRALWNDRLNAVDGNYNHGIQAAKWSAPILRVHDAATGLNYSTEHGNSQQTRYGFMPDKVMRSTLLALSGSKRKAAIEDAIDETLVVMGILKATDFTPRLKEGEIKSLWKAQLANSRKAATANK